jgi:hypothetical protein
MSTGKQAAAELFGTFWLVFGGQLQPRRDDPPVGRRPLAARRPRILVAERPSAMLGRVPE